MDGVIPSTILFLDKLKHLFFHAIIPPFYSQRPGLIRKVRGIDVCT